MLVTIMIQIKDGTPEGAEILVKKNYIKSDFGLDETTEDEEFKIIIQDYILQGSEWIQDILSCEWSEKSPEIYQVK